MSKDKAQTPPAVNKISEYIPKHDFNKFDLVQEFASDNTLLKRKWINKKNVDIVKEYNFSNNYYLKQLEDDIMECFFMTGTIYNPDEIDFEILEGIYETKLPHINAVYKYRTGTVCTGVVEMLSKYDKINFIPKTYYELFSIIGVERDYGQEKTIYKEKDDREYIIYQVPDSVCLTFKIKENNIYFGYER